VSQAQLDEFLRATIDAGVFPGCVALVWRDGGVRYFGAHGQLASHAAAVELHTPVCEHTIYDLASLTKVLATTTLIAQALGQGLLTLDQPLPAALALRAGERPRLRELLEHAAGLAAHREFFHAPWSLGPSQREALIEAVRGVALERPPLREAVYSDLGFLLLGAWLEQLHGARLDELFTAKIAEPLGIADAIGFAALDRPAWFDPARVAPTEVYASPSMTGGTSEHWHPIRAALGQRFAHAVVHDDNAVVMAGVAGHAGLFGTAAGVLAIARAWLERRLPGVPASAQERVFAAFTRPSQVPGSTRRLGFDGPSPDGSGSTGSALGGSAFGHLGFTGTSVWIDPSPGPGRGAIELLLSNRVHPSRHDSRIRAVRPRFHTLAGDC
jgi:serine-type D-Ala-D-Ala carboxypeptidase